MLLELSLLSFGGSPPAPAAPAPAEDLPAVEDPEVEAAKKKERDLNRLRRGRSSTLLTGPSGLGGPDKPSTLLGGTTKAPEAKDVARLVSHKQSRQSVFSRDQFDDRKKDTVFGRDKFDDRKKNTMLGG